MESKDDAATQAPPKALIQHERPWPKPMGDSEAKAVQRRIDELEAEMKTAFQDLENASSEDERRAAIARREAAKAERKRLQRKLDGRRHIPERTLDPSAAGKEPGE